MRIVAHRGYSGRYPENTALAFARALELPIHGVECDARLCASGEVVIHHDPALRAGEGAGRPVARLTLDELRALTPPGQVGILLFDELLDLVLATDKHLYLEIKVERRAGPVTAAVLGLLRRRGLLSEPRIHVISFSPRAVALVRDGAPRLDRVQLRRDPLAPIYPLADRVTGATTVGFSLRRLRGQPELPSRLTQPTYLWTVDRPRDLLFARRQGVDVVATNEPEVAGATLGA